MMRQDYTDGNFMNIPYTENTNYIVQNRQK